MSAPSSLLLLLLASVPAVAFMAPPTRARAPILAYRASSRALCAHCTTAESSSQDRAERSPSPIRDGNKLAAVVLAVGIGGSLIGTVSQLATVMAGVAVVMLVVAALLNEALPAAVGIDQLSGREAETDEPLQCYMVDGIESDGKPVVVCTPEPEEFCWFHGIQRSALRPTGENEVQGTLQCEEDASYRGTREYWCR